MSCTVQQARQAIAQALDDLETHLVLGGTANTVVSPGLHDATPGAAETRYRGRFLFRTGRTPGDRQRVVRPQGYAPSTGTLSFDPAVSGVSALGDQIELTHLFPVEAAGGRDQTSYIDLVNVALRNLWVPDLIALTTVAGQRGYSLAGYAAWLGRAEQVEGLWDPPVVAGYPPRPGGWRLDRTPDGGVRVDTAAGAPTLWIRAPYTTSGLTAQVAVRRPANTSISGVEGTAVSDDTQVVLSDLEEVTEVGLLHAYRVLYTRTGAAEWLTQASAKEEAVKASPRIRYLPTIGPPPDARTAPPAPQTEAA